MIYDKPLSSIDSSAIRSVLNSTSDTYEEIIKESSYLFYGFDDVINIYENNKNLYEESIDPLFSKNVLNERANQKFLETITEEVPLYHRVSDLEMLLDGDVVSRTRDASILNVPVPLQNEFWTRWLNNAWGDVYNNLLLYVYNTLRYPFLNENQYLNAYKLPEIAAEGFKRLGSGYLPNSEIRFRYTAEQNDEDLKTDFLQGCQDYLEEIVQSKTNSAYALLDYKPDHSVLLTDWINSLYESSLITYNDIDRETLVFKLQDIQYELLKRKFAGSSTLHKLALASIARTGSLVSVDKAGWDKSHSFYNTRVVSYPYMPGIITYQTNIDKNMDPFQFFKKLDTIPEGISLPLYYSSASDYDSDKFYSNEAYRYAHLRESSTVIDGDSPYSITSIDQSVERYDTLDQYYYIEGQQDPICLTLDYNPDYPLYNPTNKTGFLQLDTRTVDATTTYQSNVVLNINANKLLFHQNTLQAADGHGYRYLTIPTAADHGVSLMDLSWIDYIRSSSSRKSRLQDIITVGTQISRLIELPANQVAEHYFFTVSYNTVDDDTTSGSYEDIYGEQVPSGYAYLWYCTVKYRIDSFEIVSLEKTLLSKITLSVERQLNSSSPLADDLVQHSVGIVPFTYESLTEIEISDLRLRVNEDDTVEDSISLTKWGTAYFFFSSYDLANRSFINEILSARKSDSIAADPLKVDPTEATLKNLTEFLSSKPYKDTRNIFFAVKKQSSSTDYRYEWSDPIKVLPYSILSLDLSAHPLFNPDWRDLVYYLNPTLNYDRNTASILRKKDPLISAVSASTDDTSSGLCNLARERNNNVYCNDTGSDELATDKTFYLNRVTTSFVRNEQGEVEYLYEGLRPEFGDFHRTVNVLGDNRYEAYIRYSGEYIIPEGETATHMDPFNHYCISVSPIGFETPGESVEVPNHLLLAKKRSTTEYRPLPAATLLLNFSTEIADDDGEDHLIIGSDTISVLYRYSSSTKTSYIVAKNSDTEVLIPVAVASLYHTITTNATTDSSLRNNIRLALVASSEDSYIRVNDTIERIPFNLNSILHIFSSYDTESHKQTNNLFGNLYDLRIYQKALSDSELSFVLYGSLRELYSYSPSSYKMSYWTSKDLGIVNQTLPVLPTQSFEIKEIRAFSRDVWDSILLDTYPVFEEERTPGTDYYNEHYADPINDREYGGVKLAEDIEVFNNLKESSLKLEGGSPLKISYHSTVYSLDKTAKESVSLATTMLRPSEYADASFHSGLELASTPTPDGFSLSTTTEQPIIFPVADLDEGTLSYSSDLTPVFELDKNNDFTSYHSRGSNIEIVYDKYSERAAITLQNETLVGAETNSILTSFIIPDQTESDFTGFYIDRIVLRGTLLNSAFTSFLNANNYYNEARIPVVALVEGQPVYLNKWDAIRTLKEGTYYFTCKYPLQILPFSDYDMGRYSDNYATLYGSARFKIEVKGTPRAYNDSEYKIEGYPTSYDVTKLNKTITDGSTLYDPADNRTFPHRDIQISLYVLDCDEIAGNIDSKGKELYNFKWRKIASNVTGDSAILLNKEAVRDSLYLDSSVEIPLFFSRNYLLPFFIAKYNKASSVVDSLSADDDLIDPIRVKKNSYSSAEEQLTVSKESDLDNLVLIGGSSYKLLLDYTGKLTELSFTDKFFDDEILDDSSKEKQNFARLTNLLERTTVSYGDYLYSGTCQWYVSSDPNILSKSSGYETLDGDFVSVTESTDDVHYYGDPYSRSSVSNYILARNSQYRDAVNNLAYFPYRIHVPSEVNQIFPGNYYSSIWAVQGTWSFHRLTYVSFNEVSALRKLWEICKSRVSSAVDSLINNPLGVFAQLREFSVPVKNSSYKETPLNTVIVDESYDLYGYKAADRVIKLWNDKITIQRRGIYTNNFFVKQDFSDITAWSSSIYGSYVSDDGHGSGKKDVMEYTIPSGDNLTLTYLTGDKGISDTVETSICVKGLVGEVDVAFLRKNIVTCTSRMTSSELENGWKLYEIETPSTSVGEFDSVRFIFTNASSDSSSVRVTKAVLRRSTVASHKLGLSEVFYNPGLPSERAIVLLSGHNIVAVKHRNSQALLPLRFPAVVLKTNRITTATPNNNVTTFIMNYMLSDQPLTQLSTGLPVELIKPWVRRITLDKDNCRFAVYERTLDPATRKVYKQLISRLPDIFYTGTDTSIELNKEQIVIHNLHVNKRLGALSTYGIDLKLYDGRPVAVTYETFSGVSGAFNSNAVLNKEKSIQCITNLQYIGNLILDSGEVIKDKVLFELEYAPIIYDETTSHLTTYFFILRRDIV